jgi:geranylgeranyl transferase type-2 subunit beta
MPDSADDSQPFLLRLGARLATGLSGLEPARRGGHAAFFRARQNPDGGYSGREGGSDLYYTGFAVRGLAVLGELNEEDAKKIADYLRGHARAQLTVIDLVSWLYSALMVQAASGIDVLSGFAEDWPERLAAVFESFRTKDGGYAKTHEGAIGSTYHSFLVALCYELIGKPLPQKNRLIQFVYDRQRDDGGFVEIDPMKRGGTNPTAAAVAILRMLGGLDDPIREDVRQYLREVRTADGGFQANTRIPFADSLSTFTGLLTAQDLGFDDLLDPQRTQAFIRELEFPEGGFRGATWDQAADVEYTFYALGVLGLLGVA